MKIPIILLTVFCIVLAGCLTALASCETTQCKNSYNACAGNGYGACNNCGTCTGSNYDFNVSCSGGNCSAYPNGNYRNCYPDGNHRKYYPEGSRRIYYPAGDHRNYYPTGNRRNYCLDGNCGATKPVDNSSCPNGSCGTAEPVDNPSSNGTTTYKLCVDNVCHVGGDGSVLTLTNYDNATNPTYEHLIAFLKDDETDEKAYTSQYVCADFAETLHNNAEINGIKCALVGCDFTQGIGHAFNAFNTTDKGTVYIDCTGVPEGSTYQDKIILKYAVGEHLTSQYLFRDGNIEPMGIVKRLYVFW